MPFSRCQERPGLGRSRPGGHLPAANGSNPVVLESKLRGKARYKVLFSSFSFFEVHGRANGNFGFVNVSGTFLLTDFPPFF